MTEEKIIEGCRNDDRKAQKALFDKYSPMLFGVCKRYVKTREDAEDVLIKGLYKAMTNIHQFKGAGSFEGWVRRIVVNESLMFLRKSHNFKMTVEVNNLEIKTEVNVDDELAAQDIMNLLEKLPTGYRTVFNMYVVEGYKHREIAEILGISINTSKSQLILAKKRMRALVKQVRYPDVG